MPLKNGYSRKTMDANRVELIKNGHTPAQANIIAKNRARDSFFTGFPRGVLPAWLLIPGADQRKEAYLKWRGRK